MYSLIYDFLNKRDVDMADMCDVSFDLASIWGCWPDYIHGGNHESIQKRAMVVEWAATILLNNKDAHNFVERVLEKEPSFAF